MNIHQLADSNRLRTKRDECEETIIPGKFGQIYQHSASLFGVMYMFDSARKWGNARRRLIAQGFTLHQNGDTEGSLLFNPTPEAVKLACQAVKIRKKRIATPGDFEKLARIRRVAP